MNIRLVAATCGSPVISADVEETIKIINDNIWRDASIQFYSVRDLKQKMGKFALKGMLNDILKEGFNSYGWDDEAVYFFKNITWIRNTFRHQMSLEFDIVDAIKVCKKESMEAVDRKTLDLISPNDATTVTSFEKLQNEIMNLDGVIVIPLIIGELTPRTNTSGDINQELLKDRPEDISVLVDCN